MTVKQKVQPQLPCIQTLHRKPRLTSSPTDAPECPCNCTCELAETGIDTVTDAGVFYSQQRPKATDRQERKDGRQSTEGDQGTNRRISTHGQRWGCGCCRCRRLEVRVSTDDWPSRHHSLSANLVLCRRWFGRLSRWRTAC